MLVSFVLVYLRENYRNIKKVILWKNLVLKFKRNNNGVNNSSKKIYNKLYVFFVQLVFLKFRYILINNLNLIL